MAVYYGVVRHNRVELDAGTRLADGARVEVRPVGHLSSPADVGTPDHASAAEAEQAFLRDLLAEGLLEELPTDEAAPDEPFEPLTVRGRPLSEQIIEERR